MTEVVLQFTLLSFLATLILAFTPTAYLHPFIIATSGVALAFLAPFSLIWAVSLTGLAWTVMQSQRPHFIAVLLVLSASVLSLLFLREQTWLTALGAAYFTMRIMHVSLDWWMGKLTPPRFVPLLSYMLFLPVFLAGPINRYPMYDRQVDRRRVSSDAVFKGMERVLLGMFSVVVLGGWLVDRASSMTDAFSLRLGEFGYDWMNSAWGWIELYFVFAGLSGISIGCARIIGITVEENFNHPYKARTLVEFWSRWHMTLTQWCRDYVYQPIAISLRNPVLGVLAAMLVLGLWHESSAYYVCWSVWQAAGIVISQMLRPLNAKIPGAIDSVLAPFLILGWLSLANPIATRVLEFAQ